jgi:hypothetical protein
MMVAQAFQLASGLAGWKACATTGVRMAVNEYHLTTDWRLEGSVQEVSDLLGDTAAMARWWRAFVIDLEERDPGDARGVGKIVALHVKGWLPYELRWSFRVTESHAPHGFSIEAWGDLNGRGRWTLEEDGRFVKVHYDWRISADRPLLRYCSFALKPLFASNHRWAMARGAEGIALELQRLHAATEAERAAVPLPPTPGAKRSAPLIACVGALLAMFFVLRRRSRQADEDTAT